MLKNQKLTIGLLVVAYFLTRLINLTSLPIFNDEAIYLHWAIIMRDTSDKFFSMAMDGKQPLGMWLFGISMWFIKDPLLAGRIVSILFGLLTLLGIIFLSKDLGGIKAAIIASLLYIFSPYTLFFDRMALMESMINAISIWSLYLTCRVCISSRRLRLTILLGIILGLGFWIKSTSLLFLFLAFVSIFFALRKEKGQLIFLLAITALGMFFPILPLALQESFPLIFKKNQEFILSLDEIIKLPFWVWWNNLLKLIQTLSGYVSPLFLPVLVFAVAFLVKEKRKNWYILLFWSLAVPILLILISRNLDSRYILFIVPCFLVLVSSTLFRYRFLFILIFLPAFFLSTFLLISPVRFFEFFPSIGNFAADKKQYITGWSSGYGIGETIEFLKKEGSKKKILVGVRSDSGSPEDTVWVYFWRHPRVKVAYFLKEDKFWQELKTISVKVPVYFVSRDNQLLDHEKEMVELTRFLKPEGKNYIGIYKIL